MLSLPFRVAVGLSSFAALNSISDAAPLPAMMPLAERRQLMNSIKTDLSLAFNALAGLILSFRFDNAKHMHQVCIYFSILFVGIFVFVPCQGVHNCLQ